MSKKFSGKFDAFGRVGLKDKESRDLICVYPFKVEGTDQEIENKVKSWYIKASKDAENRIENYYVDTLTPTELKNAKDMFAD